MTEGLYKVTWKTFCNGRKSFKFTSSALGASHTILNKAWTNGAKTFLLATIFRFT